MYRKTESFLKKHTLSFSDTYSLNSYVPKGNKVIRTKLIKYLYQVIFVLLSVTKTNLLT